MYIYIYIINVVRATTTNTPSARVRKFRRFVIIIIVSGTVFKRPTNDDTYLRIGSESYVRAITRPEAVLRADQRRSGGSFRLTVPIVYAYDSRTPNPIGRLGAMSPRYVRRHSAKIERSLITADVVIDARTLARPSSSSSSRGGTADFPNWSVSGKRNSRTVGINVTTFSRSVLSTKSVLRRSQQSRYR